LGSIGVGPVGAEAARGMIAAVRASTDRPFNVNVFCNRPAVADRAREAAWLARLAPDFRRLGAEPPGGLTEIFKSFVEDDDMLAMLLAERPRVVSFHFGLPPADRIAALRGEGIVMLATATSLEEGRTVAAAGIDAVVAQGIEAGGHRGVIDPEAPDDRLGTFALTRLLVRELDIPVIAAGGVMDGAGIAACLMLGAGAAQLGTAFIACPESSADADYRAALLDPSSRHTVVTSAISGRPARCLPNRLTALGEEAGAGAVPAFPIAFDAARALHSAAKAVGESGYGPRWAGQGALLSRSMPAATLVAELLAEMDRALACWSDQASVRGR
jgi:nitronate monooxygenase